MAKSNPQGSPKENLQRDWRLITMDDFEPRHTHLGQMIIPTHLTLTLNKPKQCVLLHSIDCTLRKLAESWMEALIVSQPLWAVSTLSLFCLYGLVSSILAWFLMNLHHMAFPLGSLQNSMAIPFGSSTLSHFIGWFMFEWSLPYVTRDNNDNRELLYFNAFLFVFLGS